MKESMYRFMKVGIIYCMAFPSVAKGEGPILETIKKVILDDYFNVIEITWIKDDQTRKAVKKMLDASHMTVTFGGHPLLLTTGLNVNDIDGQKRSQALGILKAGIDEAYEMGAEAFTYLSGHFDEDKKEEAYELLLKSTKELCAYAKLKGSLKIILEVFDHEIDKKSLVGPAMLAKRLADDVTKEHDNFGITADLSHIPLIGETFEQAVSPVKQYLTHAHIGNCVLKDPSMSAYGDQHPRFGFPGSENDVEQLKVFLGYLLEIGFLNKENPPIVNFEVKPFGDEDSEIVIASSKRVLTQAWAEI